MSAVQIAPKAGHTNIEKLVHGANRVEVALAALEGANLTPKQVQQLEALLKRVSPRERAPSALQSQVVSKIKLIDGHQAVVGHISVKGQQLDTLLTEGSLNMKLSDQIGYADKLGYRLAIRGENRAYVDGLLEKDLDGSINSAEKNALEAYRKRYVRDTQGGLVVDGRFVHERDRGWSGFVYPDHGALFVRASAE